jgi:hypothetical protein
MFWDRDIPKLRVGDPDGPATTVTVVAGRLVGAEDPLPPPPSSWASRTEADLAIWHLELEPGASWTLPAAQGADTVRTLYVFAGHDLHIVGHPDAIGVDSGVLVDAAGDLVLSSVDGAEVLMLQGRPIGEPVARYGPFVMTTDDEIRQAFQDYQETSFGGWPWDRDDPNHGEDPTRFARHADGRVEHADAPT